MAVFLISFSHMGWHSQCHWLARGFITFGANPSYDPAQMQDIIAKMNELISALRR